MLALRQLGGGRRAGLRDADRDRMSLGHHPDQRSYTLRVRPSVVDLDAIARLDDLVQDVLDGRLGADAALAELDASGRRR